MVPNVLLHHSRKFCIISGGLKKGACCKSNACLVTYSWNSKPCVILTRLWLPLSKPLTHLLRSQVICQLGSGSFYGLLPGCLCFLQKLRYYSVCFHVWQSYLLPLAPPKNLLVTSPSSDIIPDAVRLPWVSTWTKLSTPHQLWILLTPPWQVHQLLSKHSSGITPHMLFPCTQLPSFCF